MALAGTNLGSRLVVPGAELEQINGAVWVSVGGALACIGCAPSGRPVPLSGLLIVTSLRIEIRGDQMFTQCSRCRVLRPLLETGLRHMSDAVWRNQPQCSPCRSIRDRRSLRGAANDNRP